MRKRKSPIVLVTVLAVMASVAFGFQYAASRPAGNPAEAPPAPPVEDGKTLGAARPGTSAEDVKGSIKKSMTSPGTPPGASPRPGPGGPGAGGPSILNPMRSSGKPEKPKPNTSSTSAQWYDKESGMGAKD